jgi:hypothetical protein
MSLGTACCSEILREERNTENEIMRRNKGRNDREK